MVSPFDVDKSQDGSNDLNQGKVLSAMFRVAGRLDGDFGRVAVHERGICEVETVSGEVRLTFAVVPDEP